MEDPDTHGVILIGEIGGADEEMAADYLKSVKAPKPVVALIAGRHAPPERRMGHAGTLTLFGRADANQKIKALRSAGVHIAPNPQDVAETMRQSLD
jgi:succinyl-CoA synthetase alpha subunit